MNVRLYFRLIFQKESLCIFFHVLFVARVEHTEHSVEENKEIDDQKAYEKKGSPSVLIVEAHHDIGEITRCLKHCQVEHCVE